MEDCPFCAIVSGDAGANWVHEDELVIAFLDHRPVNPGHMLVVPRRHTELVTDLDNRSATRMWRVGLWLNRVLRASGVRCEGVNMLLNDGRAALQMVSHVHLHVLPRFSGDGFAFSFPPGYGRPAARSALEDVASRLKDAARVIGS